MDICTEVSGVRATRWDNVPEDQWIGSFWDIVVPFAESNFEVSRYLAEVKERWWHKTIMACICDD